MPERLFVVIAKAIDISESNQRDYPRSWVHLNLELTKPSFLKKPGFWADNEYLRRKYEMHP